MFIYKKRDENKCLRNTIVQKGARECALRGNYMTCKWEHLSHATSPCLGNKQTTQTQPGRSMTEHMGRVPGKGKTGVRCCLTWGDRNWGTWARRLGWDELRGCTGGCCGCCMVLACAAPLLPNIPRLPLGICSRTTVTQALSDTTWLLLVCAGFILGDYDRQESRDQHI